MPGKTKRLRDHVILSAVAAMVAAPLLFGGAGLPPGESGLEQQPAGTVWHVTYRGGPNLPRQDIDVDLRVSANTISFAAADTQPGSEFSIPVADVTDVSDAIIEGNRNEKVFGPDDPDFTGLFNICAMLTDPEMESACIGGGIALLAAFGIVEFILTSLPYQDRFIRVAWQREGEDGAAVFQVSGRDFTPLREELERVTSKTLGNRAQKPSSQEVTYKAAIANVEEFDLEVARIRVQRWLSDQCQSRSLEQPSWLRPSRSLKTLTLCPSAPTEIDVARDQLRAQ